MHDLKHERGRRRKGLVFLALSVILAAVIVAVSSNAGAAKSQAEPAAPVCTDGAGGGAAPELSKEQRRYLAAQEIAARVISRPVSAIVFSPLSEVQVCRSRDTGRRYMSFCMDFDTHNGRVQREAFITLELGRPVKSEALVRRIGW